MLLSTHTGGYGTPAIYHVPGEYIRTCADHYKKENITFDAIFVGYLGNVDVIDSVIYFISQFPDTKVILDLIMGDHGKYYSNFDESYGTSMRRLLPHSDVIPAKSDRNVSARRKRVSDHRESPEMSCICAKNCAKWVQRYDHHQCSER